MGSLTQTIVNGAALDAINTEFNAAANEVFSGGAPGTWEMYTTKQPCSGTSVTLPLVDGVPALREWLGPKQFKELRGYALNGALRKWEASMRVPLDEINGDKSGVIAARLRDFVGRNATMYDKVISDAILANPTGYDGVAFLSASHPNVNGTTHDNLESAWSYAIVRAAMNTMELVTDEEGENLGVFPTHLMVGPANSREAMELTGSDTPRGFDAAGEPDGTVIQQEIVQNYKGGSIEVLVNKRWRGNQWLLMDLSKGMAKPMFLGEFQAPAPAVKDQPDDDNVFFDDEALYSLTAKATPLPMCWQLAHGSVTT